MSDCPESVRQIVLSHGIQQTLRHILTHVVEQKKRAQAACCSYEADEMDYHQLRETTRCHEVLSRTCEDLNK